MYLLFSDISCDITDNMRDYTNSLKALPPHSIYKEVVVIGKSDFINVLFLIFILMGDICYLVIYSNLNLSLISCIFNTFFYK